MVENHKAYFSNFLGYFIDGEQKCVKMADRGRGTIMLAEGLGNCEHELMLFKRMDSCHIFTFYGFEVENDTCLVEVEAKPARRIGAELHDIAQGGAALLDGTGWFAGPDFIGMESIFDKIQFYPELSEPVKWDFQAYRPHVVIVAIGQNDANPEDYMAADYEGKGQYIGVILIVIL